MNKQFVPTGADSNHVFKTVVHDLQRGKTVGSPTEIEWHPHAFTASCGVDCRVVTLEILEIEQLLKAEMERDG